MSGILLLTALALGGAALAYPQAMIERGLATGAGAAAGAGAGRGIVGVFRSADDRMQQAGKPPAASKPLDPKDKKLAAAGAAIPASKPASAATISGVRIAGPGVASAPAPTSVPVVTTPQRTLPQAHEQAAPAQPGAEAEAAPVAAPAAAAVAAAPADLAAEPAQAAPEGPGFTVVTYDFEMLAHGITREELVAQVGQPLTRLSVQDSAGGAEVYRYRAEGVDVAIIKLKGNLVQSIDLLEWWAPRPATLAPAGNVAKIAGL